jgi:hypothetical protein
MPGVGVRRVDERHSVLQDDVNHVTLVDVDHGLPGGQGEVWGAPDRPDVVILDWGLVGDEPRGVAVGEIEEDGVGDWGLEQTNGLRTRSATRDCNERIKTSTISMWAYLTGGGLVQQRDRRLVGLASGRFSLRRGGFQKETFNLNSRVAPEPNTRTLCNDR